MSKLRELFHSKFCFKAGKNSNKKITKYNPKQGKRDSIIQPTLWLSLIPDPEIMISEASQKWLQIRTVMVPRFKSSHSQENN